MEQSEPEEIKSAKTNETKMNETELNETKNPNGAKTTNDKKFPLLPVCLMLVIVVFVISGYELMWEMEELKRLHKTRDGGAEISTEYYSLELPRHWTSDAEVFFRPMHETYGGRDANGQSSIPEEFYQVIVFMKRGDGQNRVHLASVRMYQYLEDCQNLEDWEYSGNLSVILPAKSSVGGKYMKAFIVIRYAEEPEDLSEEERKLWTSMREELSASARSLTTDQQIRKSEKVTPKNQSSLWADFDANDTGKKHIGQTWKEHYEEEEKWQREFDRLEREKEKARKQREQEEAAKAEEARRQAAEWERIQKQNARKKAGKKTESRSSDYKDDYYKDDFDSYWDDNYDMYDDMDEAYEDWEDEYGEEE